MPIYHPESDNEFNMLLANVGTTPLIVDFFISLFVFDYFLNLIFLTYLKVRSMS